MKNSKAQILEVVVVIVLGISIIFWIKRPADTKFIFIIITALTLTASLYSRLLWPLSWFWFKIGHMMGFVTNKILLGIIFFLLLSPLSLLRKLFNKERKFTNSGWVDINKEFTSDDLTKQF